LMPFSMGDEKPSMLMPGYYRRCPVAPLHSPAWWARPWENNSLQTWFKGGGMLKKLDGVGPVDNRPSTDKLHHFVQKKEEKKRRKKIVTCDTWHVTRDTGHVTCFGGWTFSDNFSSLALTVYDSWYYEDLEEKDQSLNEWINQSMTRLFIEQPRLHRVC
jgi:hypothetical protein